MKVCILGTGSNGNSTLIESGETRVLIDAGFSGRNLEQRLSRIDISPKDINAIVISHNHSDHTKGAGVFSRNHGTPVYLTERTLSACSKIFRGTEPTFIYQPGKNFEIGSVRIEPFITVHDAADPVAVAIVEVRTNTRVGVATDLGTPNAQIRLALSGSDFLILEANHDEELLRTGPYPWAVQQRIASSHGHLSNHTAARFACELLHPRLVGVFLAHISKECNSPELAESVVGGALRAAGYEGFLKVATQEQPTEFIDIEDLRSRIGASQLTFL